MPLSPNQQKAVDLLLVEPSVAAAADKIGVDKSTVYRWLRDDEEFRTELLEAQRTVIHHNIRGLASLAEVAIDTLRSLMRSSADDEIKFKAAQEAITRLIDADIIMRANETGSTQILPRQPAAHENGNRT